MGNVRVRGWNRLWWVLGLAALDWAYGQLRVHATWGPLPVVWLVLWFPLTVLALYGSTRVFRGAEETDDPRLTWRMSARPQASFWMFLLLALTAVADVTDLAPDGYVRRVATANGYGVGVEIADLVLQAVVCALIAAMYFRSWRRLRALYPPASTPAPGPGVEPPSAG